MHFRALIFKNNAKAFGLQSREREKFGKRGCLGWAAKVPGTNKTKMAVVSYLVA